MTSPWYDFGLALGRAARRLEERRAGAGVAYSLSVSIIPKRGLAGRRIVWGPLAEKR